MVGALLAILLFVQDGHKQAESGTFLLHQSAMRGETPAVEMLLNLGADVNGADQQGRPPLHDACLKGRLDTVKLLLDRGAKIGALDENKATPLHDAALGGSAKVIELLLERKADIAVHDSKGLTPLDYATKMERSEAIRALQSALKQSGKGETTK
jgi:ankyrin repeat protein